MKRGTENLAKFKRLQRRLKLPLWQTKGLLEAVWGVTIDNAPDGDIGRLSNDDIAMLIEWDGDPDELVAALVDTGWLDADEEFRLIVHDWSEHCPRYLQGSYAKHHKAFADQRAKQRAEQPAKQRAGDDAKQSAKHGAQHLRHALSNPNPCPANSNPNPIPVTSHSAEQTGRDDLHGGNGSGPMARTVHRQFSDIERKQAVREACHEIGIEDEASIAHICDRKEITAHVARATFEAVSNSASVEKPINVTVKRLREGRLHGDVMVARRRA